MDNGINTRALEIRTFNRFYTNIIGLVNQTILDTPYSLAEARVIIEIGNAGQCTASQLIKLLQIDPAYLSRILRRFKRDGLLATARSITDGRAQILSLTTKGQEVHSTLSNASTEQLVKMLERVSTADQQKLIYYMRGIKAILSGQPDNAITIRDHKPGDAGYIAYRHGVLYEKEYGLDRVFEQYVLVSLAKYLEKPSSGNIWMAEVGGQIAGFIGIVGIDADTAQLRWFLLEPEFRGLGLGRKLMTIAMEYCQQKNFKKVFLWTFQELEAARHLYRSFGFIPTEQKENDTWKNKLIEERWDITLVD